jgi:hypothetical protein
MVNSCLSAPTSLQIPLKYMQGECGRGYKLDKDGNNSNEGVNGEKKMEGDIRSGRSEESVFLLSCISDVLEASIRVLISAS